MVVGKPATTESFEVMAMALLKEAKGYCNNIFKIELAKRSIIMSLNSALEKANQ